MPGPGVIPSDSLLAPEPWSLTLTFKDPATGNPADLVADGWTGWRAQWRPEPGSSVELAITVDATNAATGVIVVSLTGDQVQQMAGPGGWDLWADDAGGNAIPHLTQELGWQQGYTR